MTDGGAALDASGLVRCFHDGEREISVLEGLDLTVARGESVAVVGESGVGKSTLLHLLGGLDRPDGGTVRLAGRDLLALEGAELAAARNELLGFVFQFHHLLGDFDAVENVMLPLLVGGAGRPEATRRASSMLERVGIGHRLRHRPGELSGGEQQRVAVARALVARPAVVLADEPTGNLDPHTAEEVQALLLDVQREANAALVVATHSGALARSLDRTVELAGGKLAAAVTA